MKNITNKTKTILFASLIAAMILPFSGMGVAEAKKEPDMTDYVSQYKYIDTKIRDNKESIENDNKKLKDKSKLSSADIIKIEKRIKDKKAENVKLWKNADEVEKLNIESYILDDETQAIFDDALETLTENYLNTNGVYDVFPENKYRKMIVMVDPDDFETSSYTGDRDAFTIELENAIEVDVETIFEEMVLTHSTSCPNATSSCHPAKGGISVAHQGSTGVGSTLGFKALHPTYGYGFIIAEHEVPNGNERVVQPLGSSGVIGQAKVMPSGSCDCAFIQFTGGHWMYDEIWAPDFGSIYPVQTRNTASTPAGTMLSWDGIGSSGLVGSLIYESSHSGKISGISSGGDSGSAIIKPQANGKADVYGIAKGTTGGYTYYEPYDHIKDQLGLIW